MSAAAINVSTAPVGDARVLAGRYRLDGVLGRGGMATVHRAHDLVLERDVAIKLFPSVADDADLLLRHSAEVRVLATLSHPGLVALYDAGSVRDGDGGQEVYIVMELVDGPTLAEHRGTEPMSAAAVSDIGRQIAEALADVHEQQIVHRDIKPGNILTTADGPELVVKVADFGIARIADDTRLTMTGTMLGTVHYLSPEQVTGGPLGPPTDIYSLGLVLIECLSGRAVFTGTFAESAAARLTSLPTIPEGLAPGLARLLSQMTARDPEERPTAADVAAELDRLGTDAPPAADTELLSLPQTRVAPAVREGRSAARPRPGHRSWVLAGCATLLLVGGTVAALQVGGDDPSPRPTPSYPVVQGDLGSALTTLQRSVTP
ncbi:serine/threonine-protein kinase [Cellulomonas rhizosphaerae]|uniref:non-specific serine/threonine protein kinase n=1 Tax=Cellulomonas rhizosphaerae TaxID=2293719 RepID=A0A413RMQ9_9CELL|nr:serine/threonine-protein kinase [Cellulomonas rhizosphaerae]RHA42323.1 serine/threonine protein kinase [Cellulomonas rhizosphaerae]